MEDLDGHDVDATLHTMEEEEFHAGMESSMPQHNTRIKLPTTQREGVYDGKFCFC